MWGIELAVMAVMIGINSVFAGYEIALASIGLPRLRRLAEQQRRGAAVALYMKQNMEASLAVVQLGITLVGAIAAAVGGAGAEENLAPALVARFGVSEGTAEVLSLLLVVAPLTAVTIVVGELIPKVFALRHAESVCLTLSPLMRAFRAIAWPAVWLFETLVTGFMDRVERLLGTPPADGLPTGELQELRAAAAVARASRLIGGREERIIVSATELQTRPVRTIMLPAAHMSTLDVNASLADNLIAAHLDMHTRFPVVERPGDPQSVAGYVNFKDIVAALRLSPQEPSFRAIVRPIPSVRDDHTLTECLEHLMKEHAHIALVRDTAGNVVGLVTLEDMIEQLVGDIQDEYDRLPDHAMASGTAWVAGGGMPLDKLRQVTGIDLAADPPPGGAATLSLWVTGHLGRAVRGGETLERGGLRMVVRKVRRGQVQEAQLSRAGTPPGAAQA